MSASKPALNICDGRRHLSIARIANSLAIAVLKLANTRQPSADEFVAPFGEICERQGHDYSPGLRTAPRQSSAPAPKSSTTRNSRERTSQPSRSLICGPGADDR